MFKMLSFKFHVLCVLPVAIYHIVIPDNWNNAWSVTFSSDEKIAECKKKTLGYGTYGTLKRTRINI